MSFSTLKQMRALLANDGRLEFSTFRCAPESICTYSLGYVHISYYRSDAYEGCFIFSATTIDDSSWIAIGEPRNPEQAYQALKAHFVDDRTNFDPTPGETLHRLLQHHNFCENN